MLEGQLRSHQLLSASQMQAADHFAQKNLGLSQDILIERASLKAFDWIRLNTFKRIVFFAGNGNNGADALACLRHCLEFGIDAQLFCFEGKKSEGFIKQKAALEASGFSASVKEVSLADLKLLPELIYETDLWVDALLGVGFLPPLRPNHQQLIELLNRSFSPEGRKRPPVLAFDVPSGAWDGFEKSETCVRADWTLCFGFGKSMLYRPNLRKHAGQILIADIGLFSSQMAGSCELFTEVAPLDFSLQADSNKFDRGYLEVFAGSRAYSGAALLCCEAAFSAGTGLVRLHSEAELLPFLYGLSPRLLLTSDEKLPSLDRRASAVLVGPGLDPKNQKLGFLEQLLRSGLTLVLDAGALDELVSLQKVCKETTGNLRILTPHGGELARLTGKSSAELEHKTLELTLECAKTYESIVVLKGAVHVVAFPDSRCYLIDKALPVLSVAGSGDLFAGFLAGLLALTKAKTSSLSDDENSDFVIKLILWSIFTYLEAAEEAQKLYGFFTPEQFCAVLSRRSALTLLPKPRNTLYY